MLLPTDATVLGVAAEDFAREVLRTAWCASRRRRQNFRFGRGGAGDIGTLRRLVSVTGLDGVELGMVSVGGEAVSATRFASTSPGATSTGPRTCSAGRTTSPDAWPTPRRAHPDTSAVPAPGATGLGRVVPAGDADARSSGPRVQGRTALRGDPTARTAVVPNGGLPAAVFAWCSRAGPDACPVDQRRSGARVMIHRRNGPAAAGRCPDADRRREKSRQRRAVP